MTDGSGTAVALGLVSMGTAQQTILIVDRNPRVREFLGREFRNQGFAVHLARDRGQVAEALGRGCVPDVVVSDDQTGHAGEPAFLDWLAARCPGVPLVAHCFAETCQECGTAAAVVEKRGDPTNLLEAVRSVLGRDRATGTDDTGTR